MKSLYWTSSDLSRPHSLWRSAIRSGDACDAQHRAGRVARHEMDHEEHEDGDAQHDRHHLEQPARDICGHVHRYVRASGGYFESQTSSMW